MRSILARLKNPVTLRMLERFFGDHAKNLKDFEGVISIFSFVDCDVELKVLVKQLAQSDNSFILEMLTLALSAFYERNAAARAECLALLEELFTENCATAGAQYCASLALYHLNYFGEHASRQSMQLMGRMATSILSERKGVFSLGGEMQNFNIIGTYGRALSKNGHLLDGVASYGATRSALQYAIEALRQARADSDFPYYLYVCENVGLLGVLIEPRQVFAVLSEILSDVRAISRERPSQDVVFFSSQQVTQIRDQVLKSLANIRVLYRQEVDKYLLDELELPDLYSEVANQLTAEFSLETFYSWAFEQLTFRVLTRYYDDIGRDVLNGFVEGVRSGSVRRCLQIIVSRVVKRLRELSA
jgi:hypothetical protein